MSEFEDHLWREFVRAHGDVLAQMGMPTRKPIRRGPRLVAGASLGLAGVGAALGVALVLGGGTASPAFAVTKNHDGTVRVEVFRSAGIAGANAKLAALHVRAKIVQVPADRCAMSGSAGSSTYRAQAKLDPGSIPPGQTLVIASRPAGGKIELAPVGTAPPPAPSGGRGGGCFEAGTEGPGPGGPPPPVNGGTSGKKS